MYLLSEQLSHMQGKLPTHPHMHVCYKYMQTYSLNRPLENI
jgi:hypothetical protein